MIYYGAAAWMDTQTLTMLAYNPSKGQVRAGLAGIKPSPRHQTTASRGRNRREWGMGNELIAEKPDDIVGFGCPMDGTGCQPLTREFADAIWKSCEEAKAKREAAMPTEQDALNAMQNAHTRLKELGWNDSIYCPKDGTVFLAIEPGSSGIHECVYEGKWPDGSWWSNDGEMWPMRPSLYRKKESV